MRKVLFIVIVTLLFSFNGYANSRKVEKSISNTEIVDVASKNVLKTEISQLELLLGYYCYTFGYERQCMDPGYCQEYEICGDNWSEIWAQHEAVNDFLAERDCGAYQN